MKGLRRGRPLAGKSSNRGFTLIELLVVIGFLMALGVYQVQSDLRKAQVDIAGATATQLQTLVDGANAFSVNHYQEIIGYVTPFTTGLACTGTAAASTRRCTATIGSLQADGLLPNGYNNITAFNGAGSWSISYRTLGDPTTPNVEGLVISTVPWTTDGSTNASKAATQYVGLAARRLGADGGGVIPNCKTVGNSTTFCSTGGAFTLTNADYPTITTAGQIGGRVGTGTELFNAYLRRDGTLPMTGNLNMGTHDIYNMTNITGTGLATFGQISAANGAFLVDTSGRVTGDALTIAGASGTKLALSMDAAGAAGGNRDSMADGKLVLNTDDVATTSINNAGGAVVMGGSTVATPYGAYAGTLASSGSNFSVDDIYIRKIGRWASEVASQYASRGVYLAPDGSYVVQPTCQQGGGASDPNAGTAKIVVTAGDQVITTYLQQGSTVATAGGTISLPAQETIGEFANYATNDGTLYLGRPTWLIHVQASKLSSGATPQRTGNYALAHVYCEFPLANNN